MIDIKIENADAFAKRIGRMLSNITHFKRVDIGAELSAWQTEDVHRKRPFTMRSRAAGKAATMFRPHSRFEVNRSRQARRRLARRMKRKTYAGPAEYRKWSTRPILRAEEYERLIVRMNALLKAKLAWK